MSGTLRFTQTLRGGARHARRPETPGELRFGFIGGATRCLDCPETLLR
jgi:hypothetical protein